METLEYFQRAMAIYGIIVGERETIDTYKLNYILWDDVNPQPFGIMRFEMRGNDMVVSGIEHYHNWGGSKRCDAVKGIVTSYCSDAKIPLTLYR